uniref:Uncharacterized protein n=1 Tax=Setaria viridis TaxID=4556 RepID=A0A4U6U3F0_SETVI|nr:hypothetical protein SEVIR_6G104014v2 [Setaria viridis]
MPRQNTFPCHYSPASSAAARPHRRRPPSAQHLHSPPPLITSAQPCLATSAAGSSPEPTSLPEQRGSLPPLPPFFPNAVRPL